MAILSVLAATASAIAAVPLEQVKALRRERTDEKGRLTILYRFEKAGEYVTPAAQAARRGKEAADAWLLFDKSKKAVAVIAHSPFGGGETAKSYWPAEIKGNLLRELSEPLTKAGLKVEFPDLPAEDDQPAPAGKPYSKIGFSEDYEFVLLVGLHHEPIPYLGTRRTADGKVIYARGSRINAWAILFHAPTGTAFWGTTAAVRVGHRGAADAINLAAGTVLGYLDFADIGRDSIPAQIKAVSGLGDLNAVDLAAMLVQTQRPDAVAAVVKAAMDLASYRTKTRVLRYFNQRGTAQDYRMDPEQARRRRCVYASQLVTLRVPLMEQLRGMRSVQACGVAALVPRESDFEIGPLGQRYAGRLAPLGGDDETVLIAELAHSDRRGVFGRNRAAAVRNLGRCRVHIDEAMAVAKFYADRKAPRPRRGRRARRDPLKEAGRAALGDLARAKIEQQKESVQKAN